MNNEKREYFRSEQRGQVETAISPTAITPIWPPGQLCCPAPTHVANPKAYHA